MNRRRQDERWTDAVAAFNRICRNWELGVDARGALIVSAVDDAGKKISFEAFSLRRPREGGGR